MAPHVISENGVMHLISRLELVFPPIRAMMGFSAGGTSTVPPMTRFACSFTPCPFDGRKPWFCGEEAIKIAYAFSR